MGILQILIRQGQVASVQQPGHANSFALNFKTVLRIINYTTKNNSEATIFKKYQFKVPTAEPLYTNLLSLVLVTIAQINAFPLCSRKAFWGQSSTNQA